MPFDLIGCDLMGNLLGKMFPRGTPSPAGRGDAAPRGGGLCWPAGGGPAPLLWGTSLQQVLCDLPVGYGAGSPWYPAKGEWQWQLLVSSDLNSEM